MNLAGKRAARMAWVILGGIVLYGCDSQGNLAETTKQAEQKPEMSAAGMADQKKAESKASNVVTTSSGLKYEILREGSGVGASSGQTVSVHYTGWLENGTKFDSSLDRGTTFQFALGAGQVIKGWDEGVLGMKAGEKRKLTIPANLGYGSRGAGGVIPPNATLIFDVEMVSFR